MQFEYNSSHVLTHSYIGVLIWNLKNCGSADPIAVAIKIERWARTVEYRMHAWKTNQIGGILCWKHMERRCMKEQCLSSEVEKPGPKNSVTRTWLGGTTNHRYLCTYPEWEPLMEMNEWTCQLALLTCLRLLYGWADSQSKYQSLFHLFTLTCQPYKRLVLIMNKGQGSNMVNIRYKICRR